MTENEENIEKVRNLVTNHVGMSINQISIETNLSKSSGESRIARPRLRSQQRNRRLLFMFQQEVQKSELVLNLKDEVEKEEARQHE